MSSVVPLPPPGFEQLSVNEKVEYIQALWDGLDDNEVEVPEPHREVIRQRLAEHRSCPDEGRPWAEVKLDLERRLAERFRTK